MVAIPIYFMSFHNSIDLNMPVKFKKYNKYQYKSSRFCSLDTSRHDIEEAFRGFLKRDDIAIILINQTVRQLYMFACRCQYILYYLSSLLYKISTVLMTIQNQFFTSIGHWCVSYQLQYYLIFMINSKFYATPVSF